MEAGFLLEWATVSRYVTDHTGQLSLTIPPWVGAISISISWEANRTGHIYQCRTEQSAVLRLVHPCMLSGFLKCSDDVVLFIFLKVDRRLIVDCLSLSWLAFLCLRRLTCYSEVISCVHWTVAYCIVFLADFWLLSLSVYYHCYCYIDLAFFSVSKCRIFLKEQHKLRRAVRTEITKLVWRRLVIWRSRQTNR